MRRVWRILHSQFTFAMEMKTRHPSLLVPVATSRSQLLHSFFDTETFELCHWPQYQSCLITVNKAVFFECVHGFYSWLGVDLLNNNSFPFVSFQMASGLQSWVLDHSNITMFNFVAYPIFSPWYWLQTPQKLPRAKILSISFTFRRAQLSFIHSATHEAEGKKNPGI